jgi:hypothetical protein
MKTQSPKAAPGGGLCVCVFAQPGSHGRALWKASLPGSHSVPLCGIPGVQYSTNWLNWFTPLHVSPCDNNPGVCVKAADGAALTGRGANGRNPMALWGERGPLRIIIIIITGPGFTCVLICVSAGLWPTSRQGRARSSAAGGPTGTGTWCGSRQRPEASTHPKPPKCRQALNRGTPVYREGEQGQEGTAGDTADTTATYRQPGRSSTATAAAAAC